MIHDSVYDLYARKIGELILDFKRDLSKVETLVSDEYINTFEAVSSMALHLFANQFSLIQKDRLFFIHNVATLSTLAVKEMDTLLKQQAH